jgi:hypothetical protein
MKPNLVLAALFFALAANSFSQSVVDTAKKERARQQAANSKVVVTSNTRTANSIESGSTANASPNASATSTQTKPAAPPAGIVDKNGHDEKFWRAAFQKARDDAQRTAARVELLDLKIKQLNTQLLQDSTIYNRENVIGAELTTAQKDLEQARKEAELAKKKISDLEDELRRAGGPAGWAR